MPCSKEQETLVPVCIGYAIIICLTTCFIEVAAYTNFVFFSSAIVYGVGIIIMCEAGSK